MTDARDPTRTPAPRRHRQPGRLRAAGRAVDGARRVRLRRRRVVGRDQPGTRTSPPGAGAGSGRASSSTSRGSIRRRRCSASPVALPVAIAPMAVQALAHPGRRDRRRPAAAAAAGVPFTLSTMSSRSIEDGRRRRPRTATRWFQLYTQARSRPCTRSLVERAEAAGYRAIVLTVDLPVLGYRERDRRSGFVLPAHGQLRGRAAPSHGRPRSAPRRCSTRPDAGPDLTWADLATIRSWSSLPLVLKGILTAEDARLAVEHGVDAIVVSNHGARQLDRVPATVDVLEPRSSRRSTAGPRCGSTAASGAASTSSSPARSAPAACSSAGRSVGAGRRRRGRRRAALAILREEFAARAGAPRDADAGRHRRLSTSSADRGHPADGRRRLTLPPGCAGRLVRYPRIHDDRSCRPSIPRSSRPRPGSTSRRPRSATRRWPRRSTGRTSCTTSRTRRRSATPSTTSCSASSSRSRPPTRS